MCAACKPAGPSVKQALAPCLYYAIVRSNSGMGWLNFQPLCLLN